MPGEVGIVYEVVRDPVDVPGNADRINDPHQAQHPPGSNRKEGKQRQDVRKMQKPAEDR